MSRRRRSTAYWQGLARTRRLLRQMDPEMRGEIVNIMQRAAPEILEIARAEVPVRTGALRAGINVKVYPKTLQMRIGLLTAKARRELFYGYILEVGRKAKIATVRRRTKSGIVRYQMRVAPISPGKYDFVYGRARQKIFNIISPVMGRAYEKALRKLAGLADD